MQKSMTFSPSRKEEQQHQSTTDVAGRDRAREKRKEEERERGETGKMQFGSGGSTARDEDARVFLFRTCSGCFGLRVRAPLDRAESRGPEDTAWSSWVLRLGGWTEDTGSVT